MKPEENKKAYEVIARKWRPQQFDQVVGQEHVTRTLKNAIKLKRVAHAYLFVGPRGIGKTSIARIFAKALNCGEGPAEKPCDKCPSCVGITAGNNLDVREIDAASNRQIDDIRSLREDVKYVPNGRYKIYIIDEVHMLTPEAFNALLKTLEEPPAQVIFLFATTEPQKMPLTILSRCQRFDLRRIPLRMIVDHLAMIAKKEGVEIEPDALLAVARAAEGGMRDAESALDQLISFQGNKIGEQDVLTVFGLMPRKALEELSTAIFKGDIAALVKSVEQMDRHGKDMHRLLLELLEHGRNLLIYLEAGAIADEMDLTEAQLETLKNQAKMVDAERLLRIIDVLTETTDRLRYALSKKTMLEVALVRCARAAATVSLDQIVAEVRQLAAACAAGPEAGGQRTEVRDQRSEVKDQRLAHRNQERSDGAGESEIRDQRAEVGNPKAPTESRTETETRPATSAPETHNELPLLIRDWHKIIERAGKAAALARANLVDTVPVEVGPDKVVIAFDPEFAERIEQAGMQRNRAALQKALSDHLRRQVTAEFTTSRFPRRDNNDTDNGTPAQTNPNPDVETKSPAQPDKRDEWLKNEAVRKTLNLFEGKIIDVHK